MNTQVTTTASARKKSKAPPIDKKASLAAAKKALPGLAHEINERFALAAKIEGKADDHRLAAALQLAKAEELCRANDIPWKAWVEKNVKQSYETARKLLAVGKAKKPALALADLRKGNAERNKAHREKKAEEVERLERAVAAEPPAEAPTLEGIEGLKAAFSDLKPKDRVDFVKWAAEETGYELVDAFETAAPEPAKSAPHASPPKRSRTNPPPTDRELVDDMPAHLRA